MSYITKVLDAIWVGTGGRVSAYEENLTDAGRKLLAAAEDAGLQPETVADAFMLEANTGGICRADVTLGLGIIE